ncbi:hypothetical protein SOM55_09150 [Pseudomonas coleopterorum]|uniref:hypothetical protein n=1 Tax=Pseudomonas coleopterorum TaxID=1605838 RepID=UPI002A6B1869|nr:hypothetical protein [Pseudomonas coleopterorum]MDY1046966.1 hypothetical protein [Pseudomonas coleopterorum]
MRCIAEDGFESECRATWSTANTAGQVPGGISGRQLANTARSIYPDLKVLFVTVYAENATFDTDRLEPGMAVLIKPFAISNLTLKVRDMFDGGG